MKKAVKPHDETTRLKALLDYQVLDTPEEQSYDDITLLASMICKTPIALVSLIDSDRQWFKSHHGLDTRETPRDISFCGHAIHGKEVFHVPDSAQDPRFADNPLATGAPHVRFYAGAPLISSDGLVLGTLCVLDNQPRTLDLEQTRALEALARQVVYLLKMRKSMSELDQRLVELKSASQQVLDQQQQLIRARVEADRATKVKSEFLANMSHEVRTPLNGIIGMNDLLLETPLQEQQKKYATIVRDSGYALLNIINDILDFSKIESGKFELEETDFGIAAVVEGQAELLVTKAREKDISLMTFIDPNIPPVLKGDPGRIAQILLNLVSNAIKFTNKGRVVVNAHLESSNTFTHTICFSVEDTGCGISKESLNKLFQPFTQADGSTARKYGGTGLGLSISKRLVELMGGTIGLESEPGQGSKFWFRIPLCLGDSVATPSPLATLSKTLKVLVVDDDYPSGEIISTYARSWKMQTTRVENGLQAIEISKREAEAGVPYDIAVVDLRMPQMDGFEVAKHMKLDPLLKATHLILVTAFDCAGQSNETLEMGFSAYLTKPIKQSALYDAIVKVVNGEPQASGNLAQHSVNNVPEYIESKGRVLVAEDNAINQLLILTLLKNLGYSAQAVGNGREALDALNSAKYDIVLMDCQMAEVDGFEATRAIRTREGSGPRTTIIALTANAMKEDKEACLECGMDDYISKPLKKETLITVLEKWMRPQVKKVS